MAASSHIVVPLEEYLNTTYHPDRDWIDGETRERNMGEQPHASIQAFFAYWFRLHGSEWKTRIFTEQRVQTSTRNYRIADVCVVARDLLIEPIVRTPPLLCIEILSRDDRMSEIQERVEDYLAMGVRAVWVVDPRRRRAYEATLSGALQPVPDELAVADTDIRVPVREVFAELDEMQAPR